MSARLARYGFRDPTGAERELPEGWAEDERWTALLARFRSTVDPDAALRRLRALGDEVVDAALRAAEPEPLLVPLGYSEYLTLQIGRVPGLALELLGAGMAEPADLRDRKDADLVRIASVDLLERPSRASFEATGRALADLGDRALSEALAAVGSPAPLAIMAMGKYGGRELNYTSDVDVLFVTDADRPEDAEAAALEVMRIMNGPPTVFRTDADLRPEGRDGPLVRSLDAFAAYYKRWAQVWEFQSLIKCRFAAGDPAVGAAFMELIGPFVWPDRLADDAIEQVRALKARAEREVARRGLEGRQVKLGRGGIRDVEFAVQLLQLVHGRHRPDLRSPTTLDALDVLGAEGFVADEDARELAEAYVFLRHTEHRLQLHRGRQTHTLPKGPANREHLARGLGYRDTSERSALEAFEEDWRRTTAVVRRIHERLFYRPLLEAFASVPALGPTLSEEEARARLSALGFDRPPRVEKAIASMTAGASRRAKLMRAVLPAMLPWLAESPDPDAGASRLEELTEALDGLPHLLALLRDSPPVAELLCRVLGTGPVLAGLLQRDPSLVGALDPDAGRLDRSSAVAEAVAITSRATPEGALPALRRYKDGEWLRLAALDLAAGDDPMAFVRTAEDLSHVADACVEAALVLARGVVDAEHGGPPADARFAVIGMGRLGGRELSHASDLDVMFVYDGDEPCPDGTEARLYHAAVAERVMAGLSSTPPIFKMDADLRPEGKDGPLVRSLGSYREYYDRWAQLWEFQSLLRARHIAGDVTLGADLIAMSADRVFPEELSAEQVAEIRKMKARIERERVKAREDRRTQVKLGVGGLADVEFTVQLQQMRDGRGHPQLRTPNTLEAIEALRSTELVPPVEATWLRDAYLMLNRVRNHMFLLRGLATDSLPTRDEEVERLARSLGYGRRSRSRFLEHYRRVTRRARKVCDRLFYGEDA